MRLKTDNIKLYSIVNIASKIILFYGFGREYDIKNTT